MSVWEQTTYKLDIVRTIYTHLPGYCERLFGKTVAGYLDPRGSLVPVLRSDSWEDLASLLGWSQSDVDESAVEAVNELTKGVKAWFVGTHGVYTMIDAMYRGNFGVRPQYRYSHLEHSARALGSVLCASTMITPAAFMDKWTRGDQKLIEKARLCEDFAEAWKYLARSISWQSSEFIEIKQEKFFGDGNRLYYGGVLGTLIIMRGSAQYTDRCVILTRKHLDLMIGASLRISGIFDHTAREHFLDHEMKGKVIKMLDLTVLTAFRCSRTNVDKVVQSLHKARAYMQMKLFENEMTDADREACLEFQAKGLQNVLDLGAYMKLFIGVPKGRWLELLHVYKWMPPPDFDATYAFTELYEHHMSTRPSALDNLTSQDAQELWGLVVRERKLNIASAYMKIHKVWPPSLVSDNRNPTMEELDSWDPVALFPYFTYGTDISTQVKDKSTVMARLDDEVRGMGNSSDKNFLLWYLSNQGNVDTRVCARELASGSLGEENYVRVAYKGEAHKPGSRLFFMAPPRHRILLGELEGNISRIATNYPGSLQGIDALTKEAKLAKLFSLDPDTLSVEDGSVYTSYIVTFDLSKFSPRFNPAVLKDLHAFWAKVFGYQPIVDMGTIGPDSVILHTTNGLIMQYGNKGADLEGFRGRMMTLFHADLIAAACRYAKTQGYIIGKAQSAVFIDDGAVKIAAVGIGDEAKRNALRFLECMQAIYEVAGQENHPNKTIVSSIGGELLAEQYVYGQRLKCPIKAAMRLYATYEVSASCITEEFNSLFSSCQGAVKDGGDWVCAYRRLADGYLKSVHRWARADFHKTNVVKLALRMVTPKSMGGFGFPTLQSLVSTTAYDLTSEGLGILNSAARLHPTYRPEVARIIGRPVIVRDPIQILRDPGRVRLAVPIIVEGRLASAVARKLTSRGGPWTNVMAMMHDEELVDHASKVAEVLLERDVVSLPVITRAWDCTPLAYFEGIVQKFQRSASIQALIPERELTKIRSWNRADVLAIIRGCY